MSEVKAMKAADLSESQLKSLLDIEKNINHGQKTGEVYLLAVTR